jgi:hypothetical protein
MVGKDSNRGEEEEEEEDIDREGKLGEEKLVEDMD